VKKIKIMSGWSNPGGSTVAFINLCTLLGRKGYDCTFYGPHEWHLDKCRGGTLEECSLNDPEERLIVHFLKLPRRPEVSKRVVLACHEKEVYTVKDVQPFWDNIVYVSNSQMFWQGVHGRVIPNVISKLIPSKDCGARVSAGVVGSIDRNKNTRESIIRALRDGCGTVKLYGAVTDEEYFEEEIKEFVDCGDAVLYGYVDNKQAMYDSLSKVYHSSLSETFNFIKVECQKTGTEYHGLDSSESGAEVWDDDQILEAWEEELELK